MSEGDLRERVDAIEGELGRIRASLDGKRAVAGAPSPLRRVGTFLVSYWVLISFCIAIFTAVYVKIRYEVDFFETYANMQTRKDLAEVHRHLGDVLMGAMEWEAAAEAYRRALEFDPHNTPAAYGVVKSRVFEPLPGHRYAPHTVIDTRLDYLAELLPQDYQITFMRGVHAWMRQEPGEADALVRSAVKLNPRFAGGHVVLGVIAQEENDIPGAMAQFEAAIAISPDNPDAQNNLGFTRMLSGEFSGAIGNLRRADRLSPRLLTQINLGDAYRLSGDVARALIVHRAAAASAAAPGMANERFMGGIWTYNYMPLGAGDTETIRRYVKVQTPEQKRTIASFALSLDHGLLGNFDAADRHLEAALALDGTRAYSGFMANKIESAVVWLSPDATVSRWLASTRDRLLSRR